ncbi:MAG: hypothetical protein IT372_22970, partial [Polyangiaceae bacterium]|nr:hypothetical protein [Polyangiaceae bacterium]
GRAVPSGALVSPGAARIDVQAIRPGRGEVRAFGRTLRLSAFEVRALGGDGRPIDLARSHASLQRTPPDRLGDDPLADLADPDAIRFVLVGNADDLPPTLDLVSVSPSGAVVDRLPGVPLGHVACPEDVAAGLTCGSTRPIRAVADDIDRNHPMVADRSIKARLGGALIVAAPEGLAGAERGAPAMTAGRKLQMIRVAGPRASALGPIERYRARLRVIMVRPRAGGPPPMGGDDAGAIAVARAEVDRANALWAACGVSFGPPDELDVRIVDPPRPSLVAIGCDHGLPASGGEIRLRVDGREISTKVAKGMRPAAAARAAAAAISAAGFTVRVSDNPVIAAGAYGSSDLLVRRPGGAPAIVDAPASGAVSTDPTLTACIGQVELEDGLQHFGDIDAIAGTVEERSLIKSLDDGDPSTIDVIMVPSFAGGGRIGESFIYADGGAIRNTLIEDRAGLKADRASFALSHELGHVLLDDPGHPDDFGADTPTRLMDADAANASAYGPRRLTVDECVRAVRQSGPRAPVALLVPWPLVPLGKEADGEVVPGGAGASAVRPR